MKDNKFKRVQELLAEEEKKRLASRPEGSFTAIEYAQEVGISAVRARNILSNLVKAGKLKSVKVPIIHSNGRVIRRYGYIIADEKKSK